MRQILMHGKEIRIGRGKHYTTEQIIGFLRQVEMRLTERDLELLRWINGHGFVTARQAADWMGTCLQAGHRRMGLPA